MHGNQDEQRQVWEHIGHRIAGVVTGAIADKKPSEAKSKHLEVAMSTRGKQILELNET